MTAFLNIADDRTTILPLPAGEGGPFKRESLPVDIKGMLYTDSVGRTLRPFSCAVTVSAGRPIFCPLSPFPSLCQDCPIKPNQGFFRKKRLFIFPSPQITPHWVPFFIRWPRFGCIRARWPNPKSTLPYSKSTVDLGCEELIWVDKDSALPLFRRCRRSFRSIMTGQWKCVGQNPAAAKQKFFSTRIDLSCGQRSGMVPRAEVQALACPPLFSRRLPRRQPVLPNEPILKNM